MNQGTTIILSSLLFAAGSTITGLYAINAETHVARVFMLWISISVAFSGGMVVGALI